MTVLHLGKTTVRALRITMIPQLFQCVRPVVAPNKEDMGRLWCAVKGGLEFRDLIAVLLAPSDLKQRFGLINALHLKLTTGNELGG